MVCKLPVAQVRRVRDLNFRLHNVEVIDFNGGFKSEWKEGRKLETVSFDNF